MGGGGGGVAGGEDIGRHCFDVITGGIGGAGESACVSLLLQGLSEVPFTLLPQHH